jgi:hypothetical protein
MLRLLILIVATILFGVGNNISFAVMAQKLQGLQNAPFLLYSTTLLYSAIYLVVMLVFQKKTPPQSTQLSAKSLSLTSTKSSQSVWHWYLVLGALVTFPSICSQFSDPFVDGDLQSILQMITLPATWLGVRLFLNKKSTWLQICGILIVLAGAGVAVVPPAIEAALAPSPTVVSGNATTPAATPGSTASGTSYIGIAAFILGKCSLLSVLRVCISSISAQQPLTCLLTSILVVRALLIRSKREFVRVKRVG